MKKRVVRTRSAGTMTESQFWSMIRSTLRERSRWWKPILLCKLNSRRKYIGTNKRRRFEYQCNQCKNWFSENLINVDHIIPVGTLQKSEDVSAFIERLFVEVEGLQVLCESCHNEKTNKERKTKKKNNGNN